MRLTPGGNVLKGTDTPQGTLDVSDPVFQRGIELHADSVVEPEYALESIEEHIRVMWKNKHLKAIPKAAVDINGQEIIESGSHRRGIEEELEKAHIYTLSSSISTPGNCKKRLKWEKQRCYFSITPGQFSSAIFIFPWTSSIHIFWTLSFRFRYNFPS